MAKKAGVKSAGDKATSVIKRKILQIPKEPGVYQFFDAEKKLLYVGKAKDLRVRVRSYFLKSAVHAPRTARLVHKITDIKWITTRSETEALLLEANLVHESTPPFNVLLRDDKHFLYIKISKESFPKVSFVRKVEKDQAGYFGPYVKASQIRKTIDFLREALMFRNCLVEISPEGKTLKNPENRKIPCLDHQLRLCTAPCDARIASESYQQDIRQLTDFLRGNTGPFKSKLKLGMMAAAEKKEFEKAARYRDILRSVETIDEIQAVSVPANISADVIGFSFGEAKSFFHILFVRHGKVLRSENFSLPSGATPEETFQAFLRDHFGFFPEAPEQIIVSDVFPESERRVWEEFAFVSTGKKVEIILPQRGVKRDLVQLAEKNAALAAANARASFESVDSLAALQTALGLPKPPERIECYDISHLSGTHPVGSRVVFVNGKPEKKAYRKFAIKTLPTGKIDDFAAMAEIVDRRLDRLGTMNSLLEPEEITDPAEIEKVDNLLAAAGLITGLAIEKQFQFKDKSTGKTVGYARLRRRGRFAEIGGVYVLPEFQSSGVGTEIVKILVLNSSEKIIRLFLREQRLRWKLSLQSIGFTEEKSPPKPFAEAIRLRNAEEGIAMFVMKIAPKDLKQATDNSPDLLVIDGGKGQLSAVVAVLKKHSLLEKIPVCALAKREEEVFVPGQSEPLLLPKHSPASELLQQIRDEAHRFAISFNRNLRKKAETASILDDVKGIGTVSRKKLLQEFGSPDAIFAATDPELLKFLSPKTLRNLRKLSPTNPEAS